MSHYFLKIEMEKYDNDVIRKLYDIFVKLDINPEDFIKHVDEDDYVDKETFVRVFFEYLLYRAHLEDYVTVEFRESESSEDSLQDDGGNLIGKDTCDDVFENYIVYAISKVKDKFNEVVQKFLGGVEEAFADEDGKLTGGAEKRMIDQLYFYCLM